MGESCSGGSEQRDAPFPAVSKRWQGEDSLASHPAPCGALRDISAFPHCPGTLQPVRGLTPPCLLHALLGAEERSPRICPLGKFPPQSLSLPSPGLLCVPWPRGAGLGSETSPAHQPLSNLQLPVPRSVWAAERGGSTAGACLRSLLPYSQPSPAASERQSREQVEAQTSLPLLPSLPPVLVPATPLLTHGFCCAPTAPRCSWSQEHGRQEHTVHRASAGPCEHPSAPSCCFSAALVPHTWVCSVSPHPCVPIRASHTSPWLHLSLFQPCLVRTRHCAHHSIPVYFTFLLYPDPLLCLQLSFIPHIIRLL